MVEKIKLMTVGDLKNFLENVSDDTPLLFSDQYDIDDACYPIIFEAIKVNDTVVIHTSF